ncbi:hypothetical protein HAX54_048856, partial [Datura stramonium]|nr:hypothetical protein [Datura stramonium]
GDESTKEDWCTRQAADETNVHKGLIDKKGQQNKSEAFHKSEMVLRIQRGCPEAEKQLLHGIISRQ